MNNLKTIAVAALTALIVTGGLWLVGIQSGQNFGATIGASFFPHSGVGARSLKVITSVTDNTPATDGTLSVGTGSATIVNLCASVSWNPGALGTSTPNAAATSTDIAFPLALAGDTCEGSLTSATTTGARVGCIIAGNATGTVTLSNVSGNSLDLATGTAKVCITR